MAIYMDRRDGKPTGRWRVELQKAGKRFRRRVDTMEEAKKLEAEWELALRASQEPVQAKQRTDGRGVPKTLQQLVRRSEGSLWRGTKWERDNFMRLERAVQLVGPHMLIDDFDTVQADRLAEALDDVSAPTRNRYYSALNVLLKWAAKRGYRHAEPPEFSWEPEASGRIRWITEAEEAAMLQILRTDGRSDIASLVEAAIATGMRRSEILRLDGRDIEDQWVRLWETKTSTPRSVPVQKATADALRKLVGDGMPSVDTLRYQWDRVKGAMGLEHDREYVFHACRHTCATRLVMKGVDIRVIQQWLGHKRIETTMRYAHVNEASLQRALHQPHPDVVQTGKAAASDRRKKGGVGEPPPVANVLKFPKDYNAGVAKLVDAQDLGSCGLRPFSVVSSCFTRPSNDS